MAKGKRKRMNTESSAYDSWRLDNTKAMNSCLESEQATNAYPGIFTHSQTVTVEKITAP